MARIRMLTYGRTLGLITAFGVLLRLAWLGWQPLWRDEAFTAVVVQRPLGRMLDAVRADSAPPLAYLADHLLVRPWSSPAGLRLLPALAGAAAVPIGAALGRRIGGSPAALAAALLIAISPTTVLASRDARMYAVAATLVLASSLLLWRAVEVPNRLRFLGFAAVTVVALYTDYFAALGIAGQLVALLLLRVPRRTQLLAAGGALAALASLVPWLVVAGGQLAHAGASFWVPPLGVTSVGGELVQLVAGPPVEPWVPGRALLLTLQALTVVVTVAGGLLLVIRRRGVSAAGLRTAGFAALVVLGGIGALLAASVWRSLVDGRYASVLVGPLLVCVAAGLALAGRRRLLLAAAATVLATSVALAASPTHPEAESAAAYLERSAGAHDLVAAHPSQYLLLLYYGDRALQARTRVIAAQVPWFWGTAAYPPGAVLPAVPAAVIAGGHRIFYVDAPGDPPLQPPSGYSQRSLSCWTGVCVTAFAAD